MHRNNTPDVALLHLDNVELQELRADNKAWLAPENVPVLGKLKCETAQPVRRS